MNKELYRQLNAAQVAALNPETSHEELREIIIWLIDGFELQSRVVESQQAVIESYEEEMEED